MNEYSDPGPRDLCFPPSSMKHYTVKNITTSERLYQYLLDSNKIKAGDCFVNGNENFLDSDGVHAMSFFNHVSSKPEYFGLHSRTAVKAAGECYITPAEKLFLKMVGPAVSKRTIGVRPAEKLFLKMVGPAVSKRTIGVRREFLVSKGCVFEDAIGPFCIHDTYRAARNDKFVKTVADKHKKYGFKSAAAVYEAAEMTPREFGTGDRKKNVWSDFNFDWSDFNFDIEDNRTLILDGIEVDWPYTTIPDEPPKQKDCTCDLQTVLMVTGCKCGAMKCN